MVPAGKLFWNIFARETLSLDEANWILTYPENPQRVYTLKMDGLEDDDPFLFGAPAYFLGQKVMLVSGSAT